MTDPAQDTEKRAPVAPVIIGYRAPDATMRPNAGRWALAICSLVGTLAIGGALLVPVMYSAGAGHGTLFFVAVVFPLALLAGPLGIVVQCSGYGIALFVAALCGKWERVFWMIVIFHALCTFLACGIAGALMAG